MVTSFDDLMDQYDRGAISRRQLVKGLLLLALPFSAGTNAASAQPRSTGAIAPVRSINHSHIVVSDMKKSTEFYQAVLGATTREVEKGITTMTFPNATKQVGSWISLTTVAAAGASIGEHWSGKAGTYNHVGYGVDLKDPGRIVAEIKKRFPGVKTGEPNRTDQLYIYDPDGLPIQLMVIDHDGYVASDKVSDGKGGMKDVPKYKPGEHVTETS